MSLAGARITALLPVLLASAAALAWHEESHIEFRVVVPHAFHVELVSQPATLRVTERDAERGYVVRASGSVLRMSCNSPGGYRVTAAFTEPIVRRVTIRLDDGEAVLGDGETAGFPPCNCRDARRAIDYRFELAPGTRPGAYDWPVRLRFDSD